MDTGIICFHRAEGENDYLNNWYMSTFTKDGEVFSSMGQYMAYKKAILFGDL